MTDLEYLERQLVILTEKLLLARRLIEQAEPYVTAHYERSRTGFGDSAKALMNQMKSFLGE